MSEYGEIHTPGKNFTLPPAVTGVTNITSVKKVFCIKIKDSSHKPFSVSLVFFDVCPLYVHM